MEVIQQEESPVETTAPAATVDEVQSLLDEFDRRTVTSPEVPPDPSPGSSEDVTTQSQDQSTEQSLLDLIGPDPRIAELEGQVDSMRTAEHRRVELEAFNSLADEVAQQCPPHIPADYVRARMEAAAHNSEVAIAFDTRNIDRQAASLELQKVQLEIANQQRQPVPDQAQIAQLTAYAQRLDIAVRSHQILRKVTLGIINDANKIAKPYDQEAMDIKGDIQQAMRGASAPVDLKEPAPNFGIMSDSEFRNFTKRNYGF